MPFLIYSFISYTLFISITLNYSYYKLNYFNLKKANSSLEFAFLIFLYNVLITKLVLLIITVYYPPNIPYVAMAFIITCNVILI